MSLDTLDTLLAIAALLAAFMIGYALYCAYKPHSSGGKET